MNSQLGSLFSDLPSDLQLVEIVVQADQQQEAIEVQEQATDVHLVIHVQEGARAILLDRISSENVFHAVELFVDDNASVDFVSLHQSAESAGVVMQRSRIGAGARVHWHNITLNDDVTHSLVSQVVGHHAQSSVDWVFRASHKQRQQLSARNVFDAANGSGEMTLKGIAEDSAHVLCKGMIDIGVGGGGTDTYLTENVLMLDASAKVDAVPGLEIKTNDVKASHSATVSRVTREDLFYFASRGIPEADARQMYVQGFLEDQVRKLPTEELRERVLAALA